MGADLSTLLGVFAVLTDGDIATESWYLGTGPNNVGGLNRHSTVEADISPNREDYYNGCGDNHHLSSRLFKQNVALAAASKDFGLATMGNQYLANSKFSQANNPYLYYFPFPSIVSLGAFAFYPNFFSNGTYGAGGVANYESISSIIGARYNSETDEFEYVPERWPEQGWYRRATPYGAVQTLADGFGAIYTKVRKRYATLFRLALTLIMVTNRPTTESCCYADRTARNPKPEPADNTLRRRPRTQQYYPPRSGWAGPDR